MEGEETGDWMADGDPTRMQTDDAKIIEKLQASDPDGLRALLTVHGPVVIEALRRRHGDHVAADAINRAAMLIWVEMSSKYAPGKGTLGGWFLRIAQRKAIDIRRGEQRQRFTQLDFDPGYDPSECDEKAHQEEKAENAQKREWRRLAVRKVVAGLPRVQRVITECDSVSPNGEADIEVVRVALNNPIASKGSIYTARCKARATIRAAMIRLGYYPSKAGGRTYG